MTAAAAILRDLRAAATPEKAAALPRFFKTGPGEYGEGDRFLGVMVPQIRAVAKAHPDADEAAVRNLLASPWHEARECALFLLVARFGRASGAERTAIHRSYFAAAAAGRVNNWDLVDLSAPTLVGRHLLDRPRGLLDRLARRPSLWENRIAVVSTLAFIRRGELADAFRQCAAALPHPHDLMHKAVGWMLRECGKRDPDALRAFLSAHWSALPRTSLRYAIERFAPDERARWLAGPPGRP
jgi:3-methyladenine DNA glycosylase AlkD